ncbi:MAG: hypothetical protein WAK29_19255, partial [Terriglobales bacterium]
AADVSAEFANAQSPHTSEICNLSSNSYQPVMLGVTWSQYSVQPASGCTIDPPTHTWGQISAGPDVGLWAQIIPINMLTTATVLGGQQVTMTRTAQVALIPVFQFNVFSESDLSFFSGPDFNVAGPVHTNGDLYPLVGPGSTLTFNNKIEAYGNVVRTQLANGYSSSTNYNGTVDVPTTVNGCSTPTTNCVAMAAVTTNYGDGSVVGAGGNPPQSAYNGSNWNPFSTGGAPSGSNYMLTNGNWGSTTNVGTGAKKLSMPFVNGTTFPYQIIRRALSSDSTALAESREYNLASIHVLLSDDPAELSSGGSSDSNNVRLANVPANSSGYYNLPYGVTIPSGNYPSTLPNPSPNTYNLYFATASNAIPSSTCTSSSCPPDWPYPPAPWTATMMSSVGAGTDPNCILLCPTGAPYIANNGGTVTGGTGFPLSPALSGTGTSTVALLSMVPCPTASMQYNGGSFYPPLAADVPASCTTANTNAGSTGAISPYFPLVGGATSYGEATANSNLTATWNLIDGWLRVEYKDASGVWHPVTNEWLQLGFARGLTAPTLPGSSAPASGTNPINPNAILLL